MPEFVYKIHLFYPSDNFVWCITEIATDLQQIPVSVAKQESCQ